MKGKKMKWKGRKWNEREENEMEGNEMKWKGMKLNKRKWKGRKLNEREWNEMDDSWKKTFYWSRKFTAIFCSKVKFKIFEECTLRSPWGAEERGQTISLFTTLAPIQAVLRPNFTNEIIRQQWKAKIILGGFFWPRKLISWKLLFEIKKTSMNQRK